ncbi:MAG: uracil-DNA glycosylase family protein, partial [Betaproteobacteria bacterium]
PTLIPGLAFFPGGRGVFQERRELPNFPFLKVMVIGQDFDNLSNYECSLRGGEENRKLATWKQLLNLLDRAGIPPTACFFTNAYMGLRETGKNTGPSPGQRSYSFRNECLTFFRRQLVLQQPRMILCLGLHAAAFLSLASPKLQVWALEQFSKIDAAGTGLVKEVQFTDCPLTVPAVALLVHPSHRRLNIKLRTFGSLHGDEAELALLRDALDYIGGAQILAA